MKMRKTIYLMTLATLLLAASACTQDDEPQVKKTKVTFIAHLPETLSLDSRAIGDGSKANLLYFWVYDENDVEYADLRRQNVEFDQTTNTSRVSAYLTPGHVYKFAFWAQHKDTQGYTAGASSIISINYNNALCNDELRDAFWGWIPDLYVTEAGEMEQNIVLTRRLAQLNVGISRRGYQNAVNAGVDLKEYDSKIVVTRTKVAGYTGFELKGGYTPDNRQYEKPSLTFDFAPMPDELLEAEGKKWVYLALNYFQPSVTQQFLVNVAMTLRHKTTGRTLYFEFPNIPVKGTERTNILIDDIIEYVDFDIVIDENFDNLDYNYDDKGNPLNNGGN